MAEPAEEAEGNREAGGRAGHDPEAKVGRTKDGATDLTDKPGPVTDLESGAIVNAEVRAGAAADHDASLCERVRGAGAAVREALPEVPPEKLGGELCGDEGYFALEPVSPLPACGVRTVIADPQAGRRKAGQASPEPQAALQRAVRATSRARGTALLRRRGEPIERSFGPLLDQGGRRRATLRGCEKLTKRQKTGALTDNLSLLLRHLCGVGTLQQAVAGHGRGIIGLLNGLVAWLIAWSLRRCRLRHLTLATSRSLPNQRLPTFRLTNNGCFSTGC